jgi:Helix-turn-helix domain
MARVIQAYRFALDPTPRQQRSLASHAGAARFTYNWGLELVKTRLDQSQTDPSVVVPWNLFDLQREWYRTKDQTAPWWSENSKEAYKSGLDGLARALKNWSDSRAGRRRGRPVGFPRFKKKGRTRDACRFTTGPIKVLPDRKHIQLPRIGVRGPTSRRVSWLVASSRAPPASWPPLSPAPQTAGTSLSPWKSSGTFRSATAKQPSSAWTSASVSWPCSRTARWLAIPEPFSTPCGSYDGSTASSPAANPSQGGGR